MRLHVGTSAQRRRLEGAIRVRARSCWVVAFIRVCLAQRYKTNGFKLATHFTLRLCLYSPPPLWRSLAEAAPVGPPVVVRPPLRVPRTRRPLSTTSRTSSPSTAPAAAAGPISSAIRSTSVRSRPSASLSPPSTCTTRGSTGTTSSSSTPTAASRRVRPASPRIRGRAS